MDTLILYASVKTEYRFEVGPVSSFRDNLMPVRAPVGTRSRNKRSPQQVRLPHIYSSLAFAGNLSPISVASVMGAHLTEQYLSAQGPTAYTTICYTVVRYSRPHGGNYDRTFWGAGDSVGED